MSRQYEYEIYKKHCYGKPFGWGYFKNIVGKVGLEGMIIRSIERHEKSYQHYLDMCDINSVTPISPSGFSVNRNNKNFWESHSPVDDSSFTNSDLIYISRLPVTKISRKSFINQNMCLFYKMYFRRKQRK